MEFKAKVRVTGSEVKSFENKKGETIDFLSVKFLDLTGEQYECTALMEIGIENLKAVNFKEVTATFGLSMNYNRYKLKLMAIN